MDNQRNLIVAVALCLALLLGFDLVMGRLYPQPEHATTQAAALTTALADAELFKRWVKWASTLPADDSDWAFAAMGDWGRRFLPVTEELSIRAEILAEGGPDLWERFMQELRHLHLDAPKPEQSVLEELTQAYRDALARKQEKTEASS